jgi:hypothetical protein
MIDDYALIVQRARKSVEEKKTVITQPVYRTYTFRNDIQILTVSPEISNTYLKVHNLSHYKNQKITHEINIGIDIPVEYLIEEVDPNCKVFTLLELKQ